MDKRWLIGIGIGVGVVGVVGVVVYRRRKAAAAALPGAHAAPGGQKPLGEAGMQANILPAKLDPSSSPVSKTTSYMEDVDPSIMAKTKDPTAYDKGVAAGMSESLSGMPKRKVATDGIVNLDTPDQRSAYTQGYEDGWAEGSKHGVGTSGSHVGAPYGGIGQIVGRAGATRLRVGAPYGGIGQIVGGSNVGAPYGGIGQIVGAAQPQAAPPPYMPPPPPPDPFPFGQCPICQMAGQKDGGGNIACACGHQWHYLGREMHLGPWNQRLDPKDPTNHTRCVPVPQMRRGD